MGGGIASVLKPDKRAWAGVNCHGTPPKAAAPRPGCVRTAINSASSILFYFIAPVIYLTPFATILSVANKVGRCAAIRAKLGRN